MLKKILLLVVLTFLFAFTANAMSPLTGDQVERVVKTLEQLDPIMDQMEEEMKQSGESDVDPFNPEMLNNEFAMLYGYTPKAKSIIEANGFTHKTWPETASRVIKAFASIAMETEGNAGMAELEAAIAQMEADPNMSPEQKKMMKEHMLSSMKMAKAMIKAPAEDVKVVRPYFDKLSNAME
ncbi:hypothetical protein [Maridesulfovibrio salexigens]|uniref:Uncharacterized protein n=1 Tax=Maridesulfovibrio salexigens (strain ATCC 14822 / DSM 2638 / NCIMB 8403 / VKM B-1763) TaxID=526222 RepID=C6BWR7_MARSD|nr:hypothetical protein [Maridesulfovibrio salexigens]ACS80347.1 conserved hypothetical protein [Maridesulfovibrio salexigens DSM 2638]